MYNNWLYFFNSSDIEIQVKNKKEKQIVKKEWLNDGSMQISGNKPSDWTVILHPVIYKDIFTLQHQLNDDKLESLYLIKRAFEYKDNKLFEEGEKMYNNSIKKNDDIQNIILKNAKILKDSQEKIFQVKRNIYLEKNKKINSKVLTLELEKLIIDNINITKQIKEQENNYLVQKQDVLINGPAPEPPITKALNLKTNRYKLKFKQSIEKGESENEKDEIEKDEIESESEKDENKNGENEKENTKGGFIKVIKLS